MKRCALSLQLACLGLAALLLAAGCIDATRDAKIQGHTYPGLYKVEAWNEHARYYVGEKVRMRVTLTNLSRETQIWGDTKGITPVVDIRVFSARQPGGRADEYVWSQEHPDEVKDSVELKPGESYIIKWEFTPRLLEYYHANVDYIMPQLKGYTVERMMLVLDFWYGVEPPGPGP
jgi:hypothetical protein